MGKIFPVIPFGCVEKCRGCKHREWSMTQSLTQKENFLKTKLANWVDAIEPIRSVKDEKRWGYRSKTTLSTLFDGKQWQFGMWARDELISIPNCPVHSPFLNNTMRLLRENLPKSSNFQLSFIVQSGAQLVLVIKSKQKPDTSWLTNDVIDALIDLGIEGIWYHLNPSAGKRIFEKNGWHLLWGKPRSIDHNGLLYGPGAFQQLIPELYNQSLDDAQNFIDAEVPYSVIDLYCGTGNSMQRWITKNAEVLGIELGGEAVECAIQNLPKAKVLRGACRQRVPQMNSWAREQKENNRQLMMYVNPPRTGLETEVLNWIITEGKPNKIAYLSCSPGTLSKNLTILTQNGYEIKRLIPFDFFPQTIHVECLALLENN